MRISTGLIILAGTFALANCATQPSNPIYQQTTKYKGSSPQSGQSAIVQNAGYQTQAAVPIQYISETSPIQAASYTQITRDCLSKEASRKTIGTLAGGAIGALAGRKLSGDNKTIGTIAGAAIGGAAGYGIADKTIHCSPKSIPINNQSQAAIISPPYQGSIQYEQIYNASTTQISETPNSTIVENTTSLGEQGTPGYYAVQGIDMGAPIEDTSMAENINVVQQTTQSVEHKAQTTPDLAIIEPATMNFHFHTITPGDTVYSIARKSCVSVAALKRTNNINDDYYIRVGDEIAIPATNCLE